MGARCYLCKEKEATKPGKINFEYQGLKIELFKDGMSCQQCTETQFAKQFEKYSHVLTHVKGRIATIDWFEFCRQCERGNETEIVELFLGLGILATSAAGNWEILRDAYVPLNPQYAASYVYFVRDVDALGYVKVKSAQSEYNWRLQRIGEMMTKHQFEELGNLD